MGMRSGKTRTKAGAKGKTRGAKAGTRTGAKSKRARPTAKRPARSTPRRSPAVRRATRVAPVAADSNRALRELARRIVDLTVADDDTAALALYADHVESTEIGSPPSFGIDAIRQKFVMWRSMVSDAVFQARSVVADGNTIMIEWDGRVTLAGSGKVVHFPEIAVHEIANGKIVRERYYYDPSLLRQ